MNSHGPTRSLRDQESDPTLIDERDDGSTAKGAMAEEWTHIKERRPTAHAGTQAGEQSSFWRRNGEVISIIGAALAIIFFGTNILIDLSKVTGKVDDMLKTNERHEQAIQSVRAYLEEMRRENDKEMVKIDTKVDEIKNTILLQQKN